MNCIIEAFKYCYYAIIGCRNIKCELCDKRFRTKKILSQHIKSEHSEIYVFKNINILQDIEESRQLLRRSKHYY